MALHLGDLSEANGSLPVVTRNWKSIRDKKIYGNNDLPEQGRKEHRVGYLRGWREAGTCLSDVIFALQGPPQPLLSQGPQAQGDSHTADGGLDVSGSF